MSYKKTILTSLVIAIAALTVLLPGCTCEEAETDRNTTQQQQLIENISVDRFYDLVRQNEGDDKFVILDVRKIVEYDERHIEGAILIDFDSGSANFEKELNMLDKDKTYLVYCRSGSRSGQAVNTMEDLGFSTVYNMLGGINDWIEAGYPVT